MIGRADIEGSKSDVAMNAWPPQASYPCGFDNILPCDGVPSINLIIHRFASNTTAVALLLHNVASNYRFNLKSRLNANTEAPHLEATGDIRCDCVMPSYPETMRDGIVVKYGLGFPPYCSCPTEPIFGLPLARFGRAGRTHLA
ncbi:hypothetical protein P5V15_015378 [Pogonomyrmex californicus]